MPQTDEPAQTTLLVEKALTGDRFAYEQLVNLFHGGIFRMVYYRTYSTMDAEDLTQDIFIQAFKNLSRLKAAEKFKSWLFSIAVNRVFDFHRKKKFQKLFASFSSKKNDDMIYPEPAEDPSAMDGLIKQDFWKQVNMLMGRLPPMEREVFTLRFMDHLSIKEISLVLKKGESTIKTHLYRALQKFRKEPSMLAFLKENTT